MTDHQCREDGIDRPHACRAVEVDGEPVSYHGTEMTDEGRAAFTDVVRAARRRYAAEALTSGVLVDPDQWAEVIRAREAAHAKHGENSVERLPWDSDQWLRVLVEEVGEVARATTYDNGSRADLRAELVDVLAVASAWLSATDAAPTGNVAALVERSSFGTPEAKRLRESVPPEDARRVVERAEALRVTDAAPTGETPGGGDASACADWTMLDLLSHWDAEGRPVDYERQEVVADGTWHPIADLPRIIENNAAAAVEAQTAAKEAMIRNGGEQRG